MRRELLLWMAAVVGVVLAALGPPWTVAPGIPAAGWLTVTGSPEQSDFPLQFAVWWEEVRRLVRGGEPPWISDRLGGGVPLLANGQTGIPWPLHLPVWLSGAERGSLVLAILKVALAFTGMARFLRLLRCHPWACRFAATTFALSLNLWSWLPVPLSWVVAAAPWSFWLLGLALRGARPAVAGLGLLLGTLLGWSTHPESAAFLALAVAVAGLCLAWGRWRRLRRLVFALGLAVVIGVGFGLPVILTILDTSKFHGPVAPPVPISWRDKWQLASLLVLPFRLGHPADGTFAFPFPHAPVALACGTVVWLLLAAGRTRRRHVRWLWALALVGAFAFALFFELPGFRQMGRALPVLRHMTWPRVGFLLPLVLITVAALRFPLPGLGPRRLAWGWLLVQGTVLALAAASRPATYWRVWPTVPVPFLAAAALHFRKPQLLAVLAAGEMAFWSFGVVPISRAAGRTPLSELREWVQPGERVLALDEAVPANLLARMGFEDLRSNDPMRPRALTSLHRALGSRGEDLPGPITTPWAGLAGAWGVRWLLTSPQGVSGPWGVGWQEVEAHLTGGLRLYRNRRYLPPLRLAFAAQVAPGPAAAGEWEQVDFAHWAVVNRPLNLGGEGHLVVVERRPWRVRGRVEARGTVLALLHTPMTVGWKVFLDGREQSVVEANGGAMGVVVPSGAHEVEWRYHPPGLLWGWGLGSLGLAVGLLYACWRGRGAGC
ncbi:MAG: YfhO family protein [Thermoanaerobaculum sp.]|nr:YfhO family protein [Thermoanaerobaculum sp.]